MSLRWPDKDPDEVLDYKIDWTARLNGDTIATSTWIVPDGLEQDEGKNSFSDTLATVWLSGGVLNSRYVIVNRITTAGERTMDQSVTMKCKSR